MRVFIAVLLTALSAALTAGCPAPDSTTGTDQKRLDVLKKEPLVAKDSDPLTKVGFEISKTTPPKRSLVLATLADTTGDPVLARAKTADASAALREGGWTVYFAYCVPPTASPSSSPQNGRAVVPPGKPDTWTFGTYAYRHVDGVSYFASVTGTGRLVLELLAPNSHEKKSDLFPDRPAAVTKSCLDDPAQPTTAGTPLVVNTDGPDPNTGATAPNNR